MQVGYHWILNDLVADNSSWVNCQPNAKSYLAVDSETNHTSCILTDEILMQ